MSPLPCVLSIFTLLLATSYRVRSQDVDLCGRNVITDAPFLSQVRVNPDRRSGSDPLGTWPWMVSAGKVEAGGQWRHYCGGTLISRRHVLTAAHCTEVGARFLRLGDRNVTFSGDNQNVQVKKISRAHMHPKFSFPMAYHDVAVWEMSEPVSYTNFVRPICLPSSSNDAVDRYQGFSVQLTGWGKQLRNSPEIDGLLHSVPIKIFSARYCNETHRGLLSDRAKSFQLEQGLPDLFRSTVLCAGYELGGYGSCNGDSGGPIVRFADELGPREAKYVQLGVVQGGFGGCGSRDFPGIYVRLEDEDILDFVNGVIGRGPAKQSTNPSPKTEKLSLDTWCTSCLVTDGMLLRSRQGDHLATDGTNVFLTTERRNHVWRVREAVGRPKCDAKVTLESRAFPGQFLHRIDREHHPIGLWNVSATFGSEWTAASVSQDEPVVWLKSWKGDFLHRPDEGDQVTVWHTGTGNDWRLECAPASPPPPIGPRRKSGSG